MDSVIKTYVIWMVNRSKTSLYCHSRALQQYPKKSKAKRTVQKRKNSNKCEEGGNAATTTPTKDIGKQ